MRALMYKANSLPALDDSSVALFRCKPRDKGRKERRDQKIRKTRNGNKNGNETGYLVTGSIDEEELISKNKSIFIESDSVQPLPTTVQL